MNRRSFIRSLTIGLIAGPALLRQSLHHTPRVPDPLVVTINGVQYTMTNVHMDGPRRDWRCSRTTYVNEMWEDKTTAHVTLVDVGQSITPTPGKKTTNFCLAA